MTKIEFSLAINWRGRRGIETNCLPEYIELILVLHVKKIKFLFGLGWIWIFGPSTRRCSAEEIDGFLSSLKLIRVLC